MEQALEKINRLEEQICGRKTEETKLKEYVETVILSKAKDDKNEELEKEKRKTNVVIFGLRESEVETSEGRLGEDTELIESMLQKLNCESVKPVRVTRLGKRALLSSEGQDVKPRPVQVVLESEEQQTLTLKKAKNLKEIREGGWSRVYIHRDLTPAERQQRQLMVKELVVRKINGETDLMIRNGRIIKRRQ